MTAAHIADTVQRIGGIITSQDPQAYRVKKSPPLEVTFRPYSIKGCRATSGGTIILMTMNAFQLFPDRAEPLNINI
jgi:gamma-glutamyltranspeptidase